jgi:2-dehydro-3-deoxygluconokinase
MNQPRVVTFGEMLLRLSPPRYERFLESPAFSANFGGCEANVAVGLAYLGVNASYATVLPDSPVGDAALAALRVDGVDTTAVLRAAGRLGIYFVELGVAERATRVAYDRAHSAFANAQANTFDWADILRGAVWFHSSGITAAVGDNPAAALARAVASARTMNVPVSIDLNYRPALWTDRNPTPVIAPLVRDVDLLIGNARAVREMLGVDASDDSTASPDGALALARHVAETFGVHRVALTRRVMPTEAEHRWSVSLYDARTKTFAQSRVHHIQVVDRVGGGDSFAAALIASILREQPLDHAVEFAAVAGALKLAVPGDFNRATTQQIEVEMGKRKPDSGNVWK